MPNRRKVKEEPGKKTEDNGYTPSAANSANPAFEVIVLGPNGGPREDRVTGLLVRSTSTDWMPNSLIAVDGGTLLAGIIRLLKRDIEGSRNGIMQKGPFAGLRLPFKSPEANGAHVFREIIDAVLITHPHLDHISGLAINTPIVEAGNGPKSVAALPSVIAAIKNHMFNDVIWPNLSDEDGGAGLLTYNRLVEGGNNRFGTGELRGYVKACTGITTKCLTVSHGKCKQRYHAETAMHHRINSTVFAPHPADHFMLPSRAMSIDPAESIYSPGPGRSPRLSASKEPPMATVESSAFFLRDSMSGKEIIIFGDVEPDSVALEPHNQRVWRTAAPKIAAGSLRAIFIECSYNDSVDDAYLYGHLCPRHLISELRVLAKFVMEARERNSTAPAGSANNSSNTKRKWDSQPDGDPMSVSPRSTKRTRSMGGKTDLARVRTFDTPEGSALYEEEDFDFSAPHSSLWANAKPLPLEGLSVYIIHIKETLTDGPPPGVEILNQLRKQAGESHLGCQFFVPDPEQGIFI